MKKIFTLCFALLCAMTSFAQDEAKGMFDFCDKDGNVIASGSTITVDELEDFGYAYLVNTGLYAKQNVKTYNGSPVTVSLQLDIKRIDNGEVQYCFPGSCKIANNVGLHASDANQMATDIASIATEWSPAFDDDENPLDGEVNMDLTLVACTGIGDAAVVIGESSTVTVNLISNSATGVKGITDNAAVTEVARFAADGSRLSAPQKGLNIVKLSNGKTIKYINK